MSVNPFESLWNIPYINSHIINHNNQSQEIAACECVNKLKEFLDSTEKVDSQHQREVGYACCLIILDYIKKHSG
jgi:hypothetical protein